MTGTDPLVSTNVSGEIGAKNSYQGAENSHVDVLIVGAGFSGISTLYKVRKLGLCAKIFEAGADFGGVWYWNRYPGARVDSEFPFYQLNIPEAYRTWNFTERFPDHTELRKYMAHLDRTLDLRKDVFFNSEVVEASFNTEATRWTVKSSAGLTMSGKYLILATGLLNRRYLPSFPGLEKYKGTVIHSGSWPENANIKGMKVALIGAGATSVQLVQELAKETADGGSLTMFMRRPSTCIPMHQRKLTQEEQRGWKAYYPILFQDGRKSHGGFPISSAGHNIFDICDEERESFLEDLWQRGAFSFLLGNFANIMVDLKANRLVYDFWAKKVRARMTDPVKRDLMAPSEPMYPICTKRPPLEHDYYECLDMKHVEIADLNKRPLRTFTETGIITDDGKERQFDVVVMATGFDSFTGSLTNMGLKNKDGVDIKDVWKNGVRTYLGAFMNGFPNAFLIYSPQAPTAFSNGPTIIECQSDFIVDAIRKLEEEKARSIEPTSTAEDEWKTCITSMIEGTLYGATDSWWNGGNIPGKKVECMSYAAGISEYEKTCREKMDGWQGFVVEAA